MIDKSVGEADAKEFGIWGEGVQGFEQGGAEAAGGGVVFERDEVAAADVELRLEALGIDGFGEAGVGDADGEVMGLGDRLGDGLAFGDPWAECPELEVIAFGDGFGGADGDERGIGFDGAAGGVTARIADKSGLRGLDCGPEHIGEFVLILRLHDDGIGDAAQEGDIEEAVVRGAVVGGEPGAIHAKRDGQVLEANVVDDGVVGALEEGRIDSDDGFEAFAGHTGCGDDGVFLSDTDVEELVGEVFAEEGEAGTGRHGGGDADQ